MPEKKKSTYNPLDLEKKDYNRLARIYPMLKKVYPWEEARHLRNRMNMDLAAEQALEVRYLARRFGVGQGYVVRKMMEALREHNIQIDLRVR